MILVSAVQSFEMDRFRQKSKKEKPMKHVDKDQSPLFITDVKAIKENLKIKEILRTVKMNSSMRIKAPRGSKVMQNKDFNDNEDMFGVDQNSEGQNSEEQNSENPNSEDQNSEAQNIMEPPSATNPDVVVTTNSEDKNESKAEEEPADKVDKAELSEPEGELIAACDENIGFDKKLHESISVPVGLSDFVQISEENKLNTSVVPDVKIDLPPSECSHVKARDRKLSLDQTMLSRRGGLSQSELDLNSIGKSPLERKSSFFRKKMDSFLKNTTEIFKRQSISRSQSIQRRGSMSVSLQSLNESTAYNGDYGEPLHNHPEELQRSMSSLQSSPTPARSVSSLSICQSEQTLPDHQSEGESLAGSRPALTGSQPLGDTSPSIHSLNEAYIQEGMLNRAISMSSGLDSATGQNRRKSRSNRVTWLASEGLTNYLRRVIQDEKSRELNKGNSYQDFSSIPENISAEPKRDSKGRRLSYQRAVSGEDPRYHEHTIRKKQLIPENSEANLELPDILEGYATNGLPELRGFIMARINGEALDCLRWAETAENLEASFDWKSLPPCEEARQAVIRELIHTEADYIRHLQSIVQVFIATAHGLQDAGKLLDIDTQKLFSNIPDVLNASLYFWESALFPMISDAQDRYAPYNTEIMAPGFMQFRDIFEPYAKYVHEQVKALDYFRSLSNNVEFTCYLTWCYRQTDCNRLQLSDIMVKPMQRLTKYSLILRRLINYTDAEPERTSLQAMETCTKNYVLDINRSIRQKEELEKMERLANSIEAYEIDFRDDELDKCFRLYAQLNLRACMLNCAPNHSRTLIHDGDLRYKDNIKEVEAHVFLLTDMLLICKKLSKGSLHPYKLIRPKYFIERLITYPKISTRNPKEYGSLVFVAIDEVGSSHVAFSLSEPKDPSAQGTLKCWEYKLREARLTYDLAMWFSKNQSRDQTDMDVDSSSEYGLSMPSASRPGAKQSSDEVNIDREARERVAAMLHRSMGVSTEYDFFSQASMNTDSFEGELSTSHGGRPIPHGLRYPMTRTSTGGSSRNSRLSSFQQSMSAASHDEPMPGPSRYNYKAGASVDHVIPPDNPDDEMASITVNVVSESEAETVVPAQQPPPPLVVLQHSSPHKTPPQMPSRSSSGSRNTLRVQPQNVVLALVHSLPDLTFDPSPSRQQQSPTPLSASELLYQSHQELLQKNRLSAQQHQRYLSPDHRGTSYPPPSPTRASLKRGLAFSYSFKNPPLSKMGHVLSISAQAETGPSTSQGTKGDKGPAPAPGPSADKADKKPKNLNRNKGPASKDDKAE